MVLFQFETEVDTIEKKEINHKEEVSCINQNELDQILSKEPFSVLILDCRSLLEFKKNKIITAINTTCLNDISLTEITEKKLNLENFFLNYYDKLFFRQREFLKVIIYDSSCFVSENLMKIYQILKIENKSKEVFILENGFEQFSELYPLFCSLTKDIEKNLKIYLNLEERAKISHSLLFRSIGRKPKYSEKPSEILNFLYLGNAQNSISNEQLKELNIKLILNTAKECKNYFKSEFIYKKFSFIDEEFEDIFKFFDEAFEFIEMGRRNNQGILVHCFMGMSRSAAICIAYLMKYQRISLNESYNFVKKKRPIIEINIGFMEQLKNYEIELFK
eukprot:gene9340-1427_t